MIDIDRLTAAVSANAAATQSLLDLAKAKHEGEASALKAVAEAEAAHAPTAAKVDELSAFIEQSTAVVSNLIATMNIPKSEPAN